MSAKPLIESLNTQTKVEWVARVIDETLRNPADRMIVKLYLDNYDVTEIARFAGIPVETVYGTIDRASPDLERRVGCSFEALHRLFSAR